ncbi:hypothetical protein [Georgenia sunbinii]|uniref:hypothetical protein n=1 Tax=Georgenia sunbinii TaxID=3117728 RepID=UPI002F26A2A9
MALIRRAPRVPQDIAAHLPSRERALLAAPLTDGQWAVITRPALVVAGPDGLTERSTWDEIETGAWDGESRTFTITWSDRTRAPHDLRFTDDVLPDFTAALRERVQSSVIHAEIDEVGGTRVRATVRRREDGSLYSRLTAFGPLTGSPEETAQLDDLERRVREAAGLAP